MKNKKYDISTEDSILIKAALTGNEYALETLIKKHQDWIFNIAFTFTGDRNEGADLTQEVLIKAVTKLSTFNLESTFRTWLYRIAKNHFLNMKRSNNERDVLTFDKFGKGLDMLHDQSLSNYNFEVEEKLLVKEAKISCMKGMLLCLDREQRLIYILGELFGFSKAIGSEIMEISKENFRVKLHRAKKQLYSFMNDKCGLVNKKNPCRCARKTASFIKMGYVDPVKLHFQRDTISSVNEMVDEKLKALGDEVMPEYQKLYREHPFLQCPDSVASVKKLVSSPLIQQTFNLN